MQTIHTQNGQSMYFTQTFIISISGPPSFFTDSVHFSRIKRAPIFPQQNSYLQSCIGKCFFFIMYFPSERLFPTLTSTLASVCRVVRLVWSQGMVWQRTTRIVPHPPWLLVVQKGTMSFSILSPPVCLMYGYCLSAIQGVCDYQPYFTSLLPLQLRGALPAIVIGRSAVHTCIVPVHATQSCLVQTLFHSVEWC